MATLDRELETYRAKLPGLLDKAGKFVLIKGSDVQGVFDAYADALSAGYEKNKLEPFLVKKIEAVEQAGFLSRNVLPCHT
jgi:hypothetical protein